MTKQMPEVQPNALMEAGLDVVCMIYGDGRRGYKGSTSFFLSPRRDIAYEQRKAVKNKRAAMETQKAESLQFLKDLRSQIDEVIAKLEQREWNSEDMLCAESSVYVPRDWKDMK